MRWQEDPRLWTLISQVLTDPKVRQAISANGANAYLAEHGVDLSPLDITMDIDRDSNALNVTVNNAGKSFKGSVNIEMN